MDTPTPRIAESTGRPDQRYLKGRQPTISFRCHREVLAEMDDLVAGKGVSRSRFIEDAIRLRLAVEAQGAVTLIPTSTP